MLERAWRKMKHMNICSPSVPPQKMRAIEQQYLLFGLLQ